nr:MAG TPA: hypothetical protein [Bacteriophage sp.]
MHPFRLLRTLTETEITTDGAQKAHGYGLLSLSLLSSDGVDSVTDSEETE